MALRCIIRQSWEQAAYGIWLYRESIRDGQEVIEFLEPMAFKTGKPQAKEDAWKLPQSTLRLMPRDLESLRDSIQTQLLAAGLVKNPPVSEAQLKAVQAHLADMQKLTFKLTDAVIDVTK